MTIFPGSSLDDLPDDFYVNLLQRVQNYEGTGSGWIWFNLNHLDINVTDVNPLQASSYIHLMDKFSKPAFARYLVNVENTDQECFRYAVLAGLNPEKEQANKVESWKGHENDLDMSGISYPVRYSAFHTLITSCYIHNFYLK